MYIILSQKLMNKSSYDDALYSVYHFPAKYRKSINVGDIFIYAQGDKSKKENRFYYGTGTVAEISIDPGNASNYYARLSNSKEFEKHVPIMMDNKEYIEQLGFKDKRNAPPWQNSIRKLSDEAYNYIIDHAGQLKDVVLNTDENKASDTLPELPVTNEEKEDKVMSREIISLADTCSHVKAFITSNDFIAVPGTIENILLSLKTKPFVILAGISGTGKSKIVRLIADSVGGRYVLIPVHPDWSDSTDLLGHVNLDGEFCPGALTETLWEASKPENAAVPYFICLDEMNLARVEYYFSDFLSIIETRRFEDGKIVTDRIFGSASFGKGEKADEAVQKYGDLTIPENVYIIGTVNMDETTYPFSRKVLDRANTIEFSEVNLGAGLDEDSDERVSSEIKPVNLDNAVLKSEYLNFGECARKYHDEMAQMVGVLTLVNDALKPINAQIAYRVRNEIAFYISYALDNELLTFEQAFDNALMQKILPRVQGNANRLGGVLADILNALSLRDHSGKFNADNLEKELGDYIAEKQKAAKNQGIRYDDFRYDYKKSLDKIYYMTMGLNDGYTSYWI